MSLPVDSSYVKEFVKQITISNNTNLMNEVDTKIDEALADFISSDAVTDVSISSGNLSVTKNGTTTSTAIPTTTVVNSHTNSSTTDALSAYQGKYLWDNSFHYSAFTRKAHESDASSTTFARLLQGNMVNSQYNMVLPIIMVPDSNNTSELGTDLYRFKSIYSVDFYGNLTGTSSNATKDASDQTITSTYIKDLSINGNVITFTKGDDETTGTITIPGSSYTHPSSGVTAGTYKSVTVDENGHVTSGTNPTNISGYGITDVYTKTEVDQKFTDLIGGAPAALDTLKELADALGDDSNYASTVTNSLSGLGSRIQALEENVGIVKSSLFPTLEDDDCPEAFIAVNFDLAGAPRPTTVVATTDIFTQETTYEYSDETICEAGTLYIRYVKETNAGMTKTYKWIGITDDVKARISAIENSYVPKVSVTEDPSTATGPYIFIYTGATIPRTKSVRVVTDSETSNTTTTPSFGVFQYGTIYYRQVTENSETDITYSWVSSIDDYVYKYSVTDSTTSSHIDELIASINA